YEPPATQRQYLNNLEKAERSHEQSLNNYDLKVEQAQATVNDVLIELNRKRRQLDELREVLSNFTIYAPTDGMVIYFRDWSGEKRRIGSSISGWDLVVATLPDLSNMLSKTYVNEIDISKVKPGQLVRIGVDAFPEKSYTGVVKEVSNIGEQLKNADAKVFEVIIKVDGEDEILRPAMTTSNKIITASLDSAVFVPSETIFERDSITYVYKTNGTRQVVVKGPSNENFTVIERGLQAGDELYLSLPQNPTRFKLQGEELIPIIKNRLKKEAEEQAEAEKKKAEQEKGRGQRRMTMTPGVRPEGMTPGTPPANMQPGTPPANVQQKKAE
ncbi:MAG TPA: efflux RND transporter periplasmic adaptor subunit, partial [Bacteroidales bacterium]|nr:efflux RND transporter periplasmic adaptor subunit [Bacteroidales bacterium]